MKPDITPERLEAEGFRAGPSGHWKPIGGGNRLEVVGDGKVNITTSGDTWIRLARNVETMTDLLNLIAALRGRNDNERS
jgi:hypothetical protein